jgi:hypothetical protein
MQSVLPPRSAIACMMHPTDRLRACARPCNGFVFSARRQQLRLMRAQTPRTVNGGTLGRYHGSQNCVIRVSRRVISLCSTLSANFARFYSIHPCSAGLSHRAGSCMREGALLLYFETHGVYCLALQAFRGLRTALVVPALQCPALAPISFPPPSRPVFFRAAVGQMEAGRTLVGTGRENKNRPRFTVSQFHRGRFFTLSRTRLFEEMHLRSEERSREQQGLDLSVYYKHNRNSCCACLPLAVLLKSRAGSQETTILHR